MRSISTRKSASVGVVFDDGFDGGFGIRGSRLLGRLIGVVKPEIKENIDLRDDGPIYAALVAGSAN